MTIRMYSWDDADAPNLTSDGPGAMVNLLRKVLVDGYGSGDQEKPGMGWEMQWDSETNQRAAFRSSDPFSTQIWLYVDDRSGADTGFSGGNRWARAWGMETFDGWEAGEPQFTGRFPLDSQSSFGVTVAKNYQENSTVVPWIIVASERSFYLVVDHARKDGFESTANGGGGSIHFFGDIVSRLSGDAYQFAVCGGGSEDSTTDNVAAIWHIANTLSNPDTGLYISRAYNQEHLSANIYSSGSMLRSGASGWSYATGDYHYPCLVTGRLIMQKVGIEEQGADRVFRGYWPGHYIAAHNIGDDTSNFPTRKLIGANGKEWVWLRGTANSGDNGGFFLDMTGPWYGD